MGCGGKLVSFHLLFFFFFLLFYLYFIVNDSDFTSIFGKIKMFFIAFLKIHKMYCMEKEKLCRFHDIHFPSQLQSFVQRKQLPNSRFHSFFLIHCPLFIPPSYHFEFKTKHCSCSCLSLFN